MWINNGIIYESYEDIKRCLKYTSMPETINLDVLNELEFRQINPTSCPEYDPKTQYLVQEYPELLDGEYYQKWKIVNFTKEELKTKKAAFILNRLDLKISLYNKDLLNSIEHLIKNSDKIRLLQWENQHEFSRYCDFITWLTHILKIDESIMDSIFEDNAWN